MFINAIWITNYDKALSVYLTLQWRGDTCRNDESSCYGCYKIVIVIILFLKKAYNKCKHKKIQNYNGKHNVLKLREQCIW